MSDHEANPADDSAIRDADDVAALLGFIRNRDVLCPLCRYNLRRLTQARCPECKQDLELTVGILRPRFGWLLVTVVPGIFSGIAAALLMIPLIAASALGGSVPPWQPMVLDAFGWLSGFTALVIGWHRYAFLRQPQAAQRLWAIALWSIHLLAFFVLLAVMFVL